MIRALFIFLALALGTVTVIAATDDGGGLEAALAFIEACAWADANRYH